MEAAETTLIGERMKNPHWYQMHHQRLDILRMIRNKAYNVASDDPTNDHKRDELRKCRAHLRKEIKQFKQRWFQIVAEETAKVNFELKPREAWESVRTLESGTEGHHLCPTQLKMRLPDGKLAQTDNQNLAVVTPHFSRIFNGESLPIDKEQIKRIIPRKETMHTLDDPITMDKLQCQLYKASNKKSPGESGVTAEALKHLPEDAKLHFLDIVQDFFNGNSDPSTEWHSATLKCLYKNKGDAHDPTNWRGICLKDMTI